LCPICLGAYILFEAGSAIYDVYETYRAFPRSPSEGADALNASLLGAVAPGPGNAYRKAGSYVEDFASRATRNFSATFGSEREARNLARTKLGAGAIEVGPYKLRSQDGKWQFRAKPSDVADQHVHLERLDPNTGEVLQNWHLRWPNR
jgi:hypothetical protein